MSFSRNAHWSRNFRWARVLACFLVILTSGANRAFADAEQDWQKITALDVGPKGKADTREQARALMLEHFAQQDKALRQFIADYPRDTHAVEAWLRLSHLFAVRGDLEGRPEYYDTARKMLDKLEADTAIPHEKLADVSYSRVTLLMHHTPNPDRTQRETLMAYVRKFQKDHPTDHRSANLLAEMASLYDSDPRTKRELLDEALRYADDDAAKQRINDDLKRLALLGKPLSLKFDSVQGEAVDVEKYRGKVVMVYFFAGWSQPSLMGLVEVKRIADQFPKNKFQLLCISLDKTRESLDAITGKVGLTCPVFFDGKGWESPLVRSLGINALPTLWVVDRNGNLRTLNAINRTEGVIQQLIQEK